MSRQSSVLTGPVATRFADHPTMIFGLAVGSAAMGLAPDGLSFTLALLPNAPWGLAMPTLQSLMTRRVSDSEQGQLQGANNSIASIAGVASPLFFGAVYALSVGENATLPFVGTAFFIAAGVLFAGAVIGWGGREAAARS